MGAEAYASTPHPHPSPQGGREPEEEGTGPERGEGSTIVARLTPPGAAALTTIAVSGPRTRGIVDSLFHSRRARPLPIDVPLYGEYGDQIRDDVVLRLREAPAGLVAEIHCHGGPAMSSALVGATTAAGALVVSWREFERAQGRSEFQLDALEALAAAPTERVAAILLAQLNGALDRAAADPELAREALRWERFGRGLAAPWRVVLYGPANAGKSSLLNALLGFHRAIVTPIAGTTRDVVQATTAMDGWPIELVDGAGFRDDPGELEAEGARRLAEVLATGAMKILVLDQSIPRTPIDRDLEARFPPDLVAANKCDLAPAWEAGEALPISATSGEGIDVLIQRIVATVVPEVPPPGVAVPFRDWHGERLKEVAASRR